MVQEVRGNIAVEARGAVLVARVDGGPLGLFGNDIAEQLDALVERADEDPNIHAEVRWLLALVEPVPGSLRRLHDGRKVRKLGQEPDRDVSPLAGRAGLHGPIGRYERGLVARIVPGDLPRLAARRPRPWRAPELGSPERNQTSE